MHENKENSDDIFISEFFDLNDELDELDVFDAIITTGIFLVIIYGGYFIITYQCSKSIIKDK